MLSIIRFYFHAADPSLGRIDKSCLSRQTVMEIFINGITENKECLCGPSESIKSIADWPGVRLYANAEADVQDIIWNNYGLAGSIDTKWLPSNIRTLTLNENDISGSVDLTCLPDTMIQVTLSRNALSGEVSLTKLPQKMRILYLSFNNLTGKLDLSQLPATLKELCLNDNLFHGKAYFCAFPKNMTYFDVSNNADLSGDVYKNIDTGSLYAENTKVIFH